jgi:hypothetical protein
VLRESLILLAAEDDRLVICTIPSIRARPSRVPKTLIPHSLQLTDYKA